MDWDDNNGPQLVPVEGVAGRLNNDLSPKSREGFGL